jgi:phage terminase large subunit
MPDYKVIKGSIQHQFGLLRTKVQMFGGGYGNGKTAAAIVQKALPIAMAYPGCNILIARSTYPKLNDTIRKEFLKWCPKKWIKSFPLSKNSDNTCTLVNGSMINFRYIAQQGKGTADGEQTTSNLLSATYDLIIVDQMEDPEITEKDFDDLLGRLRGSAKYEGSDPTMPLTGPRWFVMCVNPTRNWVYRRLVEPYIKYQKTGIIDDNLLCKRYPRGHEKQDQPILDENGKPELLMGMVEGSTYTNSHNLDAGFIETLESTYRGQMRDRFLYGEWAAYEGLVHPAFDITTHSIPRRTLLDYLSQLYTEGYQPRYIEGYDYGMVVPSCYLLAFVDQYKNVCVIDGFYKTGNEMSIAKQQEEISRLRELYGVPEDNVVRADPAIVRKTATQRNSMSKSIAQLFKEGSFPVSMRGADNSVLSGLVKVNAYLEPKSAHVNPFTGLRGGPNIYFATELQFLEHEFTSYYWKMDNTGKRVDEPIDKNDHAMNTIKYMLASEPDLAYFRKQQVAPVHLTHWIESDIPSVSSKGHRYG